MSPTPPIFGSTKDKGSWAILLPVESSKKPIKREAGIVLIT
jgi:hypothetical protein